MKKILAVILTLVTILSVAGCGSTNTQKKPEALAPNHKEYASLTELEVTDMPSTYLSRNGKKYHMGMIHKDEKTSVGLSLPNHPREGFYRMYSEDLTYTSGIESFHYTISLSEIPVPILQEGDKIMSYTGVTGEVLSIMPVEFIGYSPLIYRINDEETYVGKNSNRSINTVKANTSTVKVLSVENGKKTAEYDNKEWISLEYGTEVEIWWHEATTGKSHCDKGTAVYAAYTYNPHDENSVKNFESVGTEKYSGTEYHTFEVTGLKPGYYAITSSIDYDTIYSIFYVSE